MAKVVKDSLQSLLTGQQLPPLPERSLGMTVDDYAPFLEAYIRKLHDYIRKLCQTLTGPNLFNELIQQLTTAQLLQLGGSGAGLGTGPLLVESFADYAYVDGTTPFGGTLAASYRDVTFRQRWTESDFRFTPGVGENDGINGGLGRTTCWAARITGKITPGFTENYTFSIGNDDGVRIYFNNVLVYDIWDNTNLNTNLMQPYACTAGVSIAVRVEVNNAGGGDNQFNLLWSSTNQTGGTAYTIPFFAIGAP